MPATFGRVNKAKPSLGQVQVPNKLPYWLKVKNTRPANLIAYWQFDESVGAVTALDSSGNGRTGAITGATFGQPGIGDGKTAALFDGAGDYINVYSASLDGAFSGAEGTVAMWLKMYDVGVWTDATERCMLALREDASNYIYMQKTTVNNQLKVNRLAGGANKSANLITTSPITWQHVVMTWSKAADQLKMFVNGSQAGATATGLGVYTGSLSAGICYAGSYSTVSYPWKGWLAHISVWNTPLTPTEIAQIAVL